MRKVLLLEHGRESLEYRGFIGAVDVGLNLAARLGAQFPHQAVQYAERLEIIALLRNRLLECLDAGLPGILHRRHRVGDQKRAEGSTADDDELPWLHEHVYMAAHGHEAA